ncbi:MAG: carbohydrate binding family 9 domain-containing protein [Gemmatimonadota bacterium]|jgi:hypothetical protein|nr:carbohydrate binding family 9 domain-containing protein [Gemmatimonadota bacterium]
MSHKALRPAVAAFWALFTLLISATTGVAQVGEEEFSDPDPAVVAPLRATGAISEHMRVAPVAHAVRISETIDVDGHLDEAVWMTAPPISDFRQTVPNEGAPVSQKTEVRFLYDDDNIYVGAWLWDTGPVLSRLARRDVGVPDADFFVVYFDSYHDHGTAYRFATSPAAMKRDEITSDRAGGSGGFGDTSWNPIWDVKTSITSEGWFVEMRIPFSQLRYSDEEVQHWGVQVERKLRRIGEDASWAFTPRSERGGVARYGHLEGIEGIAQGKRLELLPYVGGRAEFTNVGRSANADFDNPFRSGKDYFGNAGVDLKYRLTPNMTIDATVNPDFGQVELDPAVINLSAFETRYDEKRPFFVEGAEIFDFAGTTLLYSRRIGRAPQGSVPGSVAYSDVPLTSTILGAGKLSGKTPGGWSIALLDAVTQTADATYANLDQSLGHVEVEPFTNYFAGRGRYDSSETGSSYGIIVTAMNRNLSDEALRDRLRSSAYSLGVDNRWELANRRWTLRSSIAPSYITGGTSVLRTTQRSSARYFQRPDATHLSYDPDATSMAGLFGRVSLNKNAGDLRGNANITAISPGFEINDLGFQSSADRINFSSSFSYDQPRRTAHLRSWGASLSPSGSWNFAGEKQSLQLSANGDIELPSFHTLAVRLSRSFESWDDRFTRGGPNALSPASNTATVTMNTNSRRMFSLRVQGSMTNDEGDGRTRSTSATLTGRFKGIYELQIGPEFRRQRTGAQYVSTVVDALATQTFGSRYIFADLNQTTASLTMRFNATFTPDLSLELYAQPLISNGDYGVLKELAAPRTYDFNRYGENGSSISKEDDGRYLIDPDGAGPAEAFRVRDADFNVHSLLGNAVLRWEWRAGSTLFLVWQQSRSDRLTGNIGDPGRYPVGSFDFTHDTGELFSLRPDNIFQVKLSYWLNP